MVFVFFEPIDESFGDFEAAFEAHNSISKTGEGMGNGGNELISVSKGVIEVMKCLSKLLEDEYDLNADDDEKDGEDGDDDNEKGDERIHMNDLMIFELY